MNTDRVTMSTQQQFLNVIDRDEAERRFRAALRLEPVGRVEVPLTEALGRVLADDVVARVDVPSFDRSNYDGFAVRAADTFGASEEGPRRLELLPEVLTTGRAPQGEVAAGTAMTIATGGVIPRGANAVVMVEHTDVESAALVVRHPVTPGFGIAFAGTDIAAGETVLRQGELLTSRETGVLAAIGVARVTVYQPVKVAILSTGDEMIPPGAVMRPGLVYDSNAQILADAVREQGGEPIMMGIVADDVVRLRERVAAALDQADIALLSGGTSKGQGDLSYQVINQLADPGIIAHGVALKPGKPICLAAHQGRPVVILPGFPTSAVFTFHEFVAPLIRILSGRPAAPKQTVAARMAVKVRSEIGRTEYLLVGLVDSSVPERDEPGDLIAYPMGKGSGSVTTFSRADGFVTVGRHDEIVPAGAAVTVQLLGGRLATADLVVMGSHCVGLDYLVGKLSQAGYRVKSLAVGSTAGLAAAARGECDLAGIHLLDAATGRYNRPFLTDELTLIPGYARQQGLLFRADDPRFDQRDPGAVVAANASDPDCVMVNRNQGSGTRILIDQLLAGARPAGYAVQPTSHNAVAAAIVQRRADWGVAIESVARANKLGFKLLCEEQYDFVTPKSRRDRPAVKAFRQLVRQPAVMARLCEFGFQFA